MAGPSIQSYATLERGGAGRARTLFRQGFGGEARLFRAPGRVNLIGEHTDYNDGFVLPATIGLSCWVAAGKRTDQKLVVHSEQFNETCETDLSAGPAAPSGRWSDYPIGVAAILQREGIQLPGVNLLIHGEVPVGGGLSSSAAIEVATGLALAGLAEITLESARLAKICQQAEHEYARVRCGIMDQFTALHGASGHALLLDCRSLEFELLPLPEGTFLVTCHTMVKHELGEGQYNQRRANCEEAVELLRAALPEIRALRDVSAGEFELNQKLLPELVKRRARHVVTENERTRRAAAALRDGDLEQFGKQMSESHASLRDHYEVSCRELDLMVEIAGGLPGVYGSRMTGAGFGGCTVNLVETKHGGTFSEFVGAEYERRTGIRPQISVLTTAPAAGEVVGP